MAITFNNNPKSVSKLDGKIFWTILPSIQEERNGKQRHKNQPELPWRGKIVVTVGGGVFIHRMDEQGEPINHISNSACVTADFENKTTELYDTEADAMGGYVIAMQKWLQREAIKLHDALNSLKAYIENNTNAEG